MRATSEQMIAFVAQHTGARPDGITPSTRLVQDLGVDGEDLVKLLDACFARFGVDPADFRYADYGGPEGFDLIGVIASIGRKSPPLKPITIAMLTDAANAGRWLDA